MRWILASALLIMGSGCGGPAVGLKAVCADNTPLDELSNTDRIAVRHALAVHEKWMCSSDECEFRIRKLEGGNTLVRVRAVRYVEPLKQCVTVFMAQAGEVYDPSGKPVDSWPYCLLMTREMEHDPMFRPDPSFSACDGSRVRSNNSFKPTPLRGVGKAS